MPLIYFILLISSAIIAIQLAIFAWHYSLSYRISFILLMFSIAIWSLGYALELGSYNLNAKLFWAKIQYFGIVFAPLAWLVLALQYAGNEKWLSKRNLVVLSFIPVITIILAWTNEYHYLIWKNIKLISYGRFYLLDFEYGDWAKINTAYSYLLILFAIFSLLNIIFHSYHFYQKQASLLLLAVFAPLIGNAIYIFKFFPVDLTPFTFLISGIAIGWSFVHFRLFDVRPIAMHTLIENMKDGVIAVDRHHRIIVINSSAKKIFSQNLLGKFIDALADFHPNLPEYCRSKREIREEITIYKNNKKFYYELHVSPLYDKYKNLLGHLVILHDITERIKAEEALREAFEREREFKLKTSHHFLNPICIAKGYLELLREECNKGEIERAIRAIERIENVIKNIVKKGRIEE